MFIPLIVHRHYKAAFTAVILMVVFVLLPSLVAGIPGNINLHNQWINTMLAHADGFPSPNTIEAFIYNDFFMPVTNGFQYVIVGVFLLVYLFFTIRNSRDKTSPILQNTSRLVMEWFILIAMTPSIFKTDTEHFLMAFPLIVFAIIYLVNSKNVFLTICFIVIMLLYAGNSSDILGRALSYKMYTTGILGISNVLLVGTCALYVCP